MAKAKHFCLEEYVPPNVFYEVGEKAWELIDSRLIETNDALREHFGPMVINTWHSPVLIKAYGLREWSGLRTAGFFKDEPGGNMYRKFDRYRGQHKYGRASDSLFQSATAQEVREYVLANPTQFPHLKGIEGKVSWFHGDVRNRDSVRVFLS